MLLDAPPAGSPVSTGSTVNPRTEPPQGGIEHPVSPFPCYCDVRILHTAIPDGLASVTVRYVVATEGGESWMGEAVVWVCEVGAGDGYDFSAHYERTTRGHEMPQSLHGIIEEAAEAAWAAGLGGERALDAHNAELTASYLHWREVEALDLFLAETATAAGCR